MNRIHTQTGTIALASLLAVSACGEDGPMVPNPDTGPQVQSLVPAPNERSAAKEGDLVIRFDRPLDATRAAELDVRVFGRWSGAATVATVLDEGDRAIRIRPARPFATGETVTVTLVAATYRDTDGEVGRGHTWSFSTVSGPGSLTPRPVATLSVREPGESHIQTYGAYAGDLDGDGWSDLILPNEQSADIRIFMNDGTGGYSDFEIVSVPAGVDPSTNEGGDFDGDGDIDLVVGSARGTTVAVFLGDGAGGMVHSQNLVAGMAVRGVCLVDFENDGDPDLVATAFTANHVALFENSGGTFVPAGTVDAGDGEWSCAPGDVNDDGLMDVFIGTRTSNEIVALGSRGDGSFETLDRVDAGDSWMLAAGDLDGDGRVDAVSVNPAEPSLSVVSSGPQGTLVLADRYDLEGFPLAVDVGDLDGDGDLDVLTSNFNTGRFVLFENDGATLSRVPEELSAATAASCAILHDRDNDGDLDVTGIDEIDDLLFLFENSP